MTSVMWFRRDLRVHDNPALLAALEAGPTVALFVLDPRLGAASGAARDAYLIRTLRSLDADLRSLGGGLVLRRGAPEEVLPAVAEEAGATSVHVAADYGPYGRARDQRVQDALAEADVAWEPLGSPYAIAPDRLFTKSGTPFQVFTPFSKAWADHGWRGPVDAPTRSPRSFATLDSEDWPDEPDLGDATLPEAGEQAALSRWATYLEDDLNRYDDARDRPDLDATSRMSVHLKWGEIHPRTMLADLAHRRSTGSQEYRRQIAWRDFFADVLFHEPHSAWDYLKPDGAPQDYDSGKAADEAFERWKSGQTGFPFVDAGMRQLLGEGFVHNRVRMVVASFLTKDLHQPWQRGARHFLDHLVDGDLASNNHGWQWVAGTGADAAPYFRVFNPITQGEKFDPDGDYVRRWVPELRDLAGRAVHQPWKAPDGAPEGYPAPMVEHAAERREALERYHRARD